MQHQRTYANLKSPEELFTIGINRAVDLLAQKEQRGTRQVLKDLGEHPEGGAMQVLDGRYGPYVRWGPINATLPKGVVPQDVTPEQAVELIAAKQATKGGKRKRKAG